MKERVFVLFAAFVAVLALVLAPMALVRAQPPEPATVTITTPATTAEAPVTKPSEVKSDQGAVPTVDVPSGAEPTNAPAQFMWAGVAAFFLEWLKKTKLFPWLTEETSSRLKAVWGFLVAVATAVGISVAVQGSVLDPHGATITLSGISANAFKNIAWQWTAQQGWYRVAVKRATDALGRI